MLFSTLAGAVIQALSTRQTTNLPKSNIIDYQVDQAINDALLQNGWTVITFNYNLKCLNCITTKSTLEFYANEFKKQILLQELLNDNLNDSKTTIISGLGQETLTNANDTEIFSALCKVMVDQPIDCVIKK